MYSLNSDYIKKQSIAANQGKRTPEQPDLVSHVLTDLDLAKEAVHKDNNAKCEDVGAAKIATDLVQQNPGARLCVEEGAAKYATDLVQQNPREKLQVEEFIVQVAKKPEVETARIKRPLTPETAGAMSDDKHDERPTGGQTRKLLVTEVHSDETRSHVGDHSIEFAGVKKTGMDYKSYTSGQNIISHMRSRITGWIDNMAHNEEGAYVLTTDFSVVTAGVIPRRGRISTASAPFFAAGAPIRRHIIDWGYREPILEMSDSDGAEFIRGAAVDGKRLATLLNCGPLFPARSIDKLAPLVQQRRVKYNNASFYAVGWLLSFQLHDMEVFRNPHAWAAPIEGAVVSRTTQVAENQIDVLVQQFNQDLADNRIFLDGKDFSPQELALIRQVACGLPRLTAAVGGATHLVQYIHVGVMRLAVYTTTALVIPDLIPAQWTDTRVMLLMKKMSTVLGEEEAWMQGFIRASMILRGRVVQWGPIGERVRRWMPASLELSGTYWPVPGGTNPLWAWAGVNPRRTANAGYMSEINALTTLNEIEATWVAHAIGALVSAGITTMCLLCNLTTTQFNEYMDANVHSDASGLLATLRRARLDDDSRTIACPLLLRAAVNWIGCFSGMCLDWENISSHSYNRTDVDDIRPVQAHMAWDALDPGVPRIGSVLGVAFMLDVLPDCWGIAGPPVVADFSKDMVTGILGSYWSAHIGCSDYQAAASSAAPYKYIPYGAMAVGVIRQQSNIRAQWHLEVKQLFTILAQGKVETGPVVNPVVPAAWVNTLQVAEPGTILTYEWATRTVHALELGPGVIGPDLIHTLIMTQKMTYVNAGVVVGRVATSRNMDVTLAGLESLAISGEAQRESEPRAEN